MNDQLASDLDHDAPNSEFGFRVMLGAFLNDEVAPVLRRSNPKPIKRVVFGSAQNSIVNSVGYAVVPCTTWPATGRAWCVRSIYAFAGVSNNLPDPSAWASGFVNGWNDTAFSATAAAAAAQTLTITTPYVMSWRVDPAAAWPAGTNQITITNLQGGTQTYDIPGGTTNPIIVSYDEPGPFASGGNPVISVPAIVGGPAYSINAVGRSVGNGLVNPMAELWSASQVPELPVVGEAGGPLFNPPPNISSLITGNIAPLPFRDELPEDVYWCKPPEKLFMTFRNINVANTSCAWIARIDDYAQGDVEELTV